MILSLSLSLSLSLTHTHLLPQFLSRPLRPSAPFFGLILAACGMLPEYLRRRPVTPDFPLGRGAGEQDLPEPVAAAPGTSQVQHTHTHTHT